MNIGVKEVFGYLGGGIIVILVLDLLADTYPEVQALLENIAVAVGGFAAVVIVAYGVVRAASGGF